jgi:four helix bundle protein
MMPVAGWLLASAMIKSFKDLLVWQKAMEAVFETYRLSRAFPDDERFGLTAQMRRAAVSIPSNISEGHGRDHRRDYCRFLGIARGSINELETHFSIAEGLGFVSTADLERARTLEDEVSRMLRALQRKLR